MSTSDAQDHYFTAEPASAAERRRLDVELAGRTVTVHTAPGVFCPDRLDIGTAVLLREVPAPPATGNLLDLGCGWGPVALTLGLRSPGAAVWAVDVNRRALDLAADNARSVGVEDFHACTPEEVPADLRFTAIWSNPPIRVGKAVLHELLLTWLPRLEAGGAAYLVVQKNLGSDSLQKWLDGELADRWPGEFTVERHATSKGFRVLLVRRVEHHR
ncbi:class I SAM-dependent methyltransferase [Oryzihumus sp.]|jgi:16S rRNA G1207 methylase RsmC|uniref:class I SAM-dependent methyltransferase n=1 Tax=Oryzihumus sp. TaxID=1968903 RepID=UPI002ED95F69